MSDHTPDPDEDLTAWQAKRRSADPTVDAAFLEMARRLHETCAALPQSSVQEFTARILALTYERGAKAMLMSMIERFEGQAAQELKHDTVTDGKVH